jgi:hypothetical protein
MALPFSVAAPPGVARILAMTILIPPAFQSLPASLPVEGAVSIALEEGLPIFRAAQSVQRRIEALLQKQNDAELTAPEIDELDRYEEIDDYLSFVNRTIRNLYLNSLSPDAL